MSTLAHYNVLTAPSSNTYYTIWDTYCTSPQQTSPSYGVAQAKKQRQPGAYPMQWDFDKAKQLVTILKSDLAEHKLNAKRDSSESAIRRQYSQQLFNHALTDLSNNSTCRKRYDACHTQRSTELQRPSTTGPTRYGSPLYNKRADLLNRIRVKTAAARLNTDSETRRVDTKMMITETITTSNELYRLIPSRKRGKHATTLQFTDKTSADFELPAVVEPEPTEEEASEDENKRTSDGQLAEDPRLIIESLQKVTIDSEKTADEMHQGSSQSLPAVKAPLRPLSVTSSRSSESGYSDVSMVPRGKTWVDFVSVSSLGEVRGEVDDKEGNEAAEVVPVLPEPPTKQAETEEITEEAEPEPPTFICPSSEDKSREYAVRLWVANSNFDQAIKTVPLA